VPIGHGALRAFLDAFFALGHELGAGDRFLQMFDLTFDLSLMSYCVPLALGASVVTVPSDGIKYMEVYRLLEEQEITAALLVPSILAHLRPYLAEIHLPELRASLFCGEALYDDLVTEWAACAPNARVQNVYGPTEATIFCLAYDCDRGRPHKVENGIVSIGRPMKHTRILIVDEALRPVAPGEKGELCLAGAQLTPGYWNNPEKNREAFFVHEGERYYRTGDLCVRDADGDVMYKGRLDHQVKIQGYRVELSEIEHHARAVTGCKHAAAVACPDAAGNTAVHLYLERFEGEIPAMLDLLRGKLPPYMIPTRTTSLEALPLNANGKIDRPALARRGL
jgi:non-ribosomal peptide synthetase component F